MGRGITGNSVWGPCYSRILLWEDPVRLDYVERCTQNQPHILNSYSQRFSDATCAFNEKPATGEAHHRLCALSFRSFFQSRGTTVSVHLFAAARELPEQQQPWEPFELHTGGVFKPYGLVSIPLYAERGAF